MATSVKFWVAGNSVRELAQWPLDDRAWIVVCLDIVEIGPHPLVGAVGVDTEGTKRVLGLSLAEGDPDDWSAAAEELLRDVVGRGVRLDRRRLVVTDGSAQLRDAALAVFGGDTYVQACRPHREREVLPRVRAKEPRVRAKEERDKAREALREAWEGGAEEGPRLLERLVGQLARDGWEGAANRLRAGSSDLFTVDRFGLDSGLARSLVTTGVIDCASSGLRRQICGVPSWGDREVALAWAAASFLATERGYMKIRGHGAFSSSWITWPRPRCRSGSNAGCRRGVRLLPPFLQGRLELPEGGIRQPSTGTPAAISPKILAERQRRVARGAPCSAWFIAAFGLSGLIFPFFQNPLRPSHDRSSSPLSSQPRAVATTGDPDQTHASNSGSMTTARARSPHPFRESSDSTLPSISSRDNVLPQPS